MRLVMIVIIIWASLKTTAQPYRLVCSDASLPELYTHIEVYAEVLQNGSYERIPPRRYSLTSAEAIVRGNDVSYNRTQVYRQGGALHFNMFKGSNLTPLTLKLPVLTDIRYNLFTDSIKPVLNYYLNIEGEFSNGKIYPLDTSFVAITASAGRMTGLEWIPPAHIHFDKVTFTATCLYAPQLTKTITIYMKKHKDPRDAPDYEEKR
jgi:hypothetical protein